MQIFQSLTRPSRRERRKGFRRAFPLRPWPPGPSPCPDGRRPGRRAACCRQVQQRQAALIARQQDPGRSAPGARAIRGLRARRACPTRNRPLSAQRTLVMNEGRPGGAGHHGRPNLRRIRAAATRRRSIPRPRTPTMDSARLRVPHEDARRRREPARRSCQPGSRRAETCLGGGFRVAAALIWLGRITAGKTYAEIADEDGVPKCRVQQAICYAFLAPDIIRQVLQGRQPVGLTSKWVFRHPLPLDWTEQRALIAPSEPEYRSSDDAPSIAPSQAPDCKTGLGDRGRKRRRLVTARRLRSASHPGEAPENADYSGINRQASLSGEVAGWGARIRT